MKTNYTRTGILFSVSIQCAGCASLPPALTDTYNIQCETIRTRLMRTAALHQQRSHRILRVQEIVQGKKDTANDDGGDVRKLIVGVEGGGSG